MAAKITSIKTAKRQPEVDVTKLVCNCDTQAFMFRVTAIGEQVIAECCLCLSDYGPFFLKQSVIQSIGEKDSVGD